MKKLFMILGLGKVREISGGFGGGGQKSRGRCWPLEGVVGGGGE